MVLSSSTCLTSLAPKQMVDALLRLTTEQPPLIRIEMLRNVVSYAIDMEDPTSELTYPIDPFRCIEQFQKDSLTAVCGNTSRILAELYGYAGFDAFTYRCGLGTLTANHECVLVKHDTGLVIQDGFYNVTFRDTLGNVRYFYPMREEIRKGDFSNIIIDEDTVITQFWFGTEQEADSVLGKGTQWYQRHVKGSFPAGSGRWCVRLERSYSIMVQALMPAIGPMLRKRGLPENYLTLYAIERTDSSGAALRISGQDRMGFRNFTTR